MIAKDHYHALMILVGSLALVVSGAVQAGGHEEAPVAVSAITEEDLEQAGSTNLQELLPELVTTARRREENVLEVPIAITGFSSEQIKRGAINSLDDVAANTPGFSVQNFFGQTLNKPVVRGVAPVAIFGESNTAVFIDGIFVSSDTGINFGFLDIERIEVLKGPQGAYFGNNAFSGAVNYVTAKPSDSFGVDAEVQVGEDGKQLLRSTMGGPLVPDTLSASISALYDDYDGAYKNASPTQDRDIGGYTYKAASASLYFTPTDDFTAKWNLYISDDDIDPPALSTVPANCQRRSPTSSRFLNYCGELPSVRTGDLATIAGESGQSREVFRTSLKLDWDTDIGTFSSLTGYSDTESETFANGNPGATNTVFSYTPDPTVNVGSPFFPVFETKLFDGGELLQNSAGPDTNEDFSQEFRFTSPRENRTRYTVGAYYFEQEVESLNVTPVVSASNPLPADFVAPPPFLFGQPVQPGFSQFCALCVDIVPAQPGVSGQAFNPIYSDDPNVASAEAFFGTPAFLFWFGGGDPSFNGSTTTETTDIAFFGSVEHDFTDDLTGYAELRYTDREIDKEVRDANGAPRDIADDNYDTDYTTWRASLTWSMSETQTVYGSIATGEKGGGLDTFTVEDTGTPIDGTEAVFEFDNEKNTTYELGYKATYNEGKVVVDSAIYYIDWEDVVLRNLIDEFEGQPIRPVGVSQNLGDADIWGFELGLNALVTDNVTVGFGASYNDTDFCGESDRYAEFPAFAPDGKVCGRNLPRQPDTQLNLNLTYRDMLTGDWEWYARADGFYTSRWYVDVPNQADVPERYTANARIGVESDRYTLELYSTNVFDEDSAIGGYRDPYFSTVTQDTFRNSFFPWRITIQHPQRRLVALRLIGRFGGD